MTSSGKRIDAQRLKSHINAVEFYSRETGFLVSNELGWQTAVCPIHDDTNPSLRVLIPGGAFKCQACGAKGGDVISFIMQKNGMDFLTALRYLQREYGGG
jgi:DNA primase